MGVDELCQLGCAGSREGDDTCAVLFEERADDGETDASGVRSARSLKQRRDRLGCAGDEDDWLGHVGQSESFSATVRDRKLQARPASFFLFSLHLAMPAVRAAFSRLAPALASARTRHSIPVSRAALARSYATQSENSVCTFPNYMLRTTHATHR